MLLKRWNKEVYENKLSFKTTVREKQSTIQEKRKAFQEIALCLKGEKI